MSGRKSSRESPKLKLSPLHASPSPGKGLRGRSAVSASVSKSPSKQGHAASGANTFEATSDGMDTPAGGRFVRREIENAALSRKPSPLKKKEVLSLWENYRKKLWDETCVGCNVDPSSVIVSAENNPVHFSKAHTDRDRDTTTTSGVSTLRTLAQLNQHQASRLEEDVHPDEYDPNTASTRLPDTLPLDVILQVRQILCHLRNEDITSLKPGYFQELVTLGHLVIRRSQEYYS